MGFEQSPSAHLRRKQPFFHRFKLNFEQRVLARAIWVWLPTFIVAVILLWQGDYSSETRWTILLLLGITALGTAASVRSLVVRPLQTLANMLSAIREQDYSFKARGGSRDEGLGELILEVNALSDAMRTQTHGAMEAIALVKQVMAEIDIAVFTFDAKQQLRLVNRAGEELLAIPAERLLGRSAAELGLDQYLTQREQRNVQAQFAGRQGRWLIQTRSFRERGVPHTLMLISDLSRALRQEEREAWQRLVRVLGHELNNSLAPVKSIAGTLKTMIERPQLPADWQSDTQRGLDVIVTRADALARFMQGFTRLARLPSPNPQVIDVEQLVRHAAALEQRLHVRVIEGPAVKLSADPDQLEQVLINLIKNAVDATLPSKGNVAIGWKQANGSLEIFIRDEGEGILDKSNLFVPFFTTKPGGSGIGLALSRQITEAHGGLLRLENRHDRLGCIASVSLPVMPAKNS